MSDMPILKVTAQRPKSFYIRAAANFLKGTNDKPAVPEIQVSGLGNAINTAVVVAGAMESDGTGKITKVETSYPDMGKYGVPLVKIWLKSEAGSDEVDSLPLREGAKLIDGKLKKIVKEGGKRGVEIEGACDMGGLQFFCTALDGPEGDADYLWEALKAASAKIDPTEEERKGGAGHVGKMFFSSGDKALAIAAHVPKHLRSKINCEEWVKTVLAKIGAGEILAQTTGHVKAEIKADKEKSRFPIKMKDECLAAAIAYLKERGCFPDKDSDSDDDFVFGDDDFPS